MFIKARNCSLIVSLMFSINSNAARPIRGTYEVPVTEDLQSHATYPVKYKADNYGQDPNTLTFFLPSALVGTQKLVTLTRDLANGPQSTTWSGKNAQADCQNVERSFRCVVKFNDLAIIPEEVEAAVRAQFKLPEAIEGRIQVARVFEGEPIGIINYKLRGGDHQAD